MEPDIKPAAEPETRKACLAVKVLCDQLRNEFSARANELASIAFASDQLDPKEWAFDFNTASYRKIAVKE